MAERLKEDVGALKARIDRQDQKAADAIRLTAVDTLIAGPLIPLLQRSRAGHPRMLLDIQSGISIANLRQREGYAALRAGGVAPGNLYCRRL